VSVCVCLSVCVCVCLLAVVRLRVPSCLLVSACVCLFLCAYSYACLCLRARLRVTLCVSAAVRSGSPPQRARRGRQGHEVEGGGEACGGRAWRRSKPGNQCAKRPAVLGGGGVVALPVFLSSLGVICPSVFSCRFADSLGPALGPPVGRTQRQRLPTHASSRRTSSAVSGRE